MMPTVPSAAVDPFALHWSLYPRQYIAPKALRPLVIDGNIYKPEWEAIPFSDPFDEIRGSHDAPPGTRPSVACRTRMKIMYDDDYLYICALIESDFTVTANFTHRNDPIYQKDSDFEVFLNPSGSCHNYKELEVNAINTVWNLMLDKPYDDGGIEHSGRIHPPGDKEYYEVFKQQTATKVIKGKIGDPNGGATWAVELALAHSDVLAQDPYGTRPLPGQRWRVNFSRVEHQGDINWTWQPQRIWDPELQKVVGKVAMHLPDAWGYVEFAPGDVDYHKKQQQPLGDVSGNALLENPERRDPTWPARLAVMNVYYAQRRYRELNDQNKYAANLNDLKNLVDMDIVKPFIGCNSDSNDSDSSSSSSSSSSISIDLFENSTAYKATVLAPGNIKATVNEQRLLLVEQIGKNGVTIM